MDDAARPRLARGANDRIPRHVSNSIKQYKYIGVSLNGRCSHTYFYKGTFISIGMQLCLSNVTH